MAVALAECCLLGGYGFAGEVAVEGRIDAALFGEGQGRVVVSARAEAAVRLVALAEEEGVVPLTRTRRDHRRGRRCATDRSRQTSTSFA